MKNSKKYMWNLQRKLEICILKNQKHHCQKHIGFWSTQLIIDETRFCEIASTKEVFRVVFGKASIKKECLGICAVPSQVRYRVFSMLRCRHHRLCVEHYKMSNPNSGRSKIRRRSAWLLTLLHQPETL